MIIIPKLRFSLIVTVLLIVFYGNLLASSFEVTTGGEADSSISYRIGDVFLEMIEVSDSASTDQFAGGSGTEEDPWQIETAEHLNNVRNYLGEEDKYFVQTADIDLYDATREGGAYWNAGKGWKPIGNTEKRFEGRYDGNGFNVHGLNINRTFIEQNVTIEPDLSDTLPVSCALPRYSIATESIRRVDDSTDHKDINELLYDAQQTSESNDYSYQGLFGFISAAKIIGLGVIDVNITGEGIIGGLVGFSKHSAIENCYVTGIVKGKGNDIGGLVGYNYQSHISCCYTDVYVSGRHYVGGLVGDNHSSTIENCYTRGSVAGELSTGGLTGANTDSTIKYSYSVNILQNKSYTIGGLSGVDYRNTGNDNHGVVHNSFWNIETSLHPVSYGGTFLYAYQMIDRASYIAWDFDDIWIKDEGLTFPYLFWESAKQDNGKVPPLMPPRMLGLTTTDRTVNLKWIAPYKHLNIPTGYNVYCNNELLNYSPIMDTLYQHNNLNYWNKYNYTVTALYDNIESKHSEPVATSLIIFSGGSGTKDSPYSVVTAEQLNGVRFRPDSYYVQVSDIDLDIAPYNEAEGWIPIGTSENLRFSGSYNGNGFLIKNLYIDRDSCVQGLFGLIDNAVITNVQLQNANIRGKNVVGGLAGFNRNSKISNSNCSGIITGNIEVGGLVGVNQCGANISNCYSNAEVKGLYKVGGLIGVNEGCLYNTPNITDCYTIGSVAGNKNTGGLTGYYTMSVIVNRCFSAAKVTSYSNHNNSEDSNMNQFLNSYWNIDTSQQSSSEVGEGRTTAQLTYPHNESTYTGWDFEEVWKADVDGTVNGGYPYLRIFE